MPSPSSELRSDSVQATAPLRSVVGLVVLALATALWLLLQLQDLTYGDGVLYLKLARDGWLYGHHHLFLPGLVGWTRLLETFGVDDRSAGFAFSAFAITLGSTFLGLTLRRTCGTHAFALVLLGLLVVTTPVATFFGTTAENHAQHFAWCCLALWLLARARERGSTLAWSLAGLGLAAVPASHLTGYMLVPAYVLFAGTGLLRQARPRAKIAVLLLPLLLYTALFQLSDWFRADVLGLPENFLGSAIGAEVEAKILARGLRPLHWLPYLWDAWLRPAWGAWLVVAFALPCLWRRQRAFALVLGLALVAYIVPCTLHEHRERGAYFLALLPLAALAIALAWTPLSRRVLGVLLAVIVLQGADAWLWRANYPTRSDADENGFVDLWARDALAVDPEVPAAARVYFVLSPPIWRTFQLEYDGPAGVLASNVFTGAGAAEKAALLQLIVTDFARRLDNGAVYVTEELWQQLPGLWPELRQLLEMSYRLEKKQHGRFEGRRVLAR